MTYDFPAYPNPFMTYRLTNRSGRVVELTEDRTEYPMTGWQVTVTDTDGKTPALWRGSLSHSTAVLLFEALGDLVALLERVPA